MATYRILSEKVKQSEVFILVDVSLVKLGKDYISVKNTSLAEVFKQILLQHGFWVDALPGGGLIFGHPDYVITAKNSQTIVLTKMEEEYTFVLAKPTGLERKRCESNQ